MKYVFDRHFAGGDQKSVMAPLIDCHDPGRAVSREPDMYSGSLNNVEQFSVHVSFNTFYSIAKSRFLTCLPHVPFRGMAAGFLSPCIV